MADSNDALRKLEDRLLRAVQVFKQTLAEKRALQKELESIRSDSRDSGKRIDELEREVQLLRREREDVRRRIEKLVDQIDALQNSDERG